MKQKIFCVNLVILFFIYTTTNAQLYEVPLEEQTEESSLIVEGIVTKSESFVSDNREIFTAHEIKVSKIFKGDTSKDLVTIITKGGTFDGLTTTWTHFLTLQKGHEGVFFLKNTSYPMIQGSVFPSDKFGVYSSLQGFYQYHTLENKNIIIANPFTRFESLNDFYDVIQNMTGQDFVSKDDDRNDKRTGIRYVFKNFEITGNTVNFEVFVNGLYDSYKLYQSGIIIGYNDFFGQNVVSNGFLQSTPLEIATPSSYDFSLNDYSSDIAMFKSNYIGGNFSIVETYEKPFAKGSFQIINLTTIPDIKIDLNQINALNKYYDSNGTAVPFDTIIVEHDFKGSPVCFPFIDSFTPDTVAAGIGQVLTIRGDCFGDYVDGASQVRFLNAYKGGGGISMDEWSSPIRGDYLLWSDTLIRVEVPSIGWDVVPVISQLDVAGSGPFQVCNKDGECFFSTFSGSGQNGIFVKYAARNSWTELNETPSEKSLPVSLLNRNGLGGISLRYDNNFTTTIGAIDAFERALTTWKCNTGVNFNTDQSTSNTNPVDTAIISFRNLPTGISSTIALMTPKIGRCKDTINNVLQRGELNSFTIQFNENLIWHFDEDLTNLDSTKHDFQSTALHEIGHGHLLKHVMQNSDPMYFARPKGIERRTLTDDNIEGGNYMMEISSFSIAQSNCNDPMIPIDTTGLNCYLVNSISNISNEIGSLILYPNPTSENLTFNFESEYSENVKITIFDIYGRKVKELSYNKSVDKLTDTIDLADLLSGMYLMNVTLQDSRRFISKQFIKL